MHRTDAALSEFEQARVGLERLQSTVCRYARRSLVRCSVLGMLACGSPATGDGEPATRYWRRVRRRWARGSGRLELAGRRRELGRCGWRRCQRWLGGVAPVVCAPFTRSRSHRARGGLGQRRAACPSCRRRAPARSRSRPAGIYVEPGTPEMLAMGQYLADKLKPATGYALARRCHERRAVCRQSVSHDRGC